MCAHRRLRIQHTHPGAPLRHLVCALAGGSSNRPTGRPGPPLGRGGPGLPVDLLELPPAAIARPPLGGHHGQPYALFHDRQVLTVEVRCSLRLGRPGRARMRAPHASTPAGSLHSRCLPVGRPAPLNDVRACCNNRSSAQTNTEMCSQSPSCTPTGPAERPGGGGDDALWRQQRARERRQTGAHVRTCTLERPLTPTHMCSHESCTPPPAAMPTLANSTPAALRHSHITYCTTCSPPPRLSAMSWFEQPFQLRRGAWKSETTIRFVFLRRVHRSLLPPTLNLARLFLAVKLHADAA